MHRKTDAYEMTDSQKSHEYEMTGAQKIHEYEMTSAQKKKSVCVRDDGCTEKT